MAIIKYHGHSTFELELGGALALVDPCVNMNIRGSVRKVPSTLQPHLVKRCDVIFITHEACCEVSTVAEIAERTYASVVAPKPSLARLDISDKFKVDVRTGDRFSIKGLDVEVVKALNPQSEYPVGYVVRGGGLGVYHAGVTYSYTEMAHIKADVALLPIGGGHTMDPFAAATICKEMRPKIAVPMYYNTYERIEQDPQEFVSDLGSVRGVVLKPGEGIKM